MQVANLVIDMAANVARLRNDMEQARKVVEGTTAKMAKAAAFATKGLGLIGVGASVAGIANMVNQFARASTELSKFSRLANSSAEDFQKISFAANKFGVSQEKLADILKDTQDKVGDFMQTGGGAMADFFEKVAPKVGVTADQFRKLNGADALQLYVSSLEKANLSQSDMVFYMEAIASDSTLLLPLLKDNGAAFNALSKEAEELGLIMSNEVIKAGREFDENTTKLSGSIKSLTVEIAGPLMSALANMTSEFLKAIRAGDTFFGVIARGLSGGVVGERSSLAQAGEDVARLRKELEAAQRVAGDTEIGSAEQTRVGMLSADLAKATKNYDDLAAAARRTFAENDPRRIQSIAEPFTKAGKESKAAVAKVKEAVDEFAPLYAKLMAPEGFDSDYAKNMGILSKAYADGKISLEDLIKISDKYTKSQKFYSDQTKDLTEEQKRLNKELVEYFGNQTASDDAHQASIKSATELIDEIERETQALTMTNAEREIAIKLRALETAGLKEGSAEYEIYAQKIREAISGKAAIEESINQQKKAEADWAKTWDQVSQSFTDALMQGGRSVKEYLIGLFRTMVLRPVIQATVGGLTGSASGAASAGNPLGSIMQLSGMGASFGSYASTGFMHSVTGGGFGTGMQAGQSIMSAGNTAGGTGMMAGTLAGYAAGAIAGHTLGRKVSDGYSTGGSGNSAVNVGTAIGMALGGPIGAALGGLAGGVFNRAFGRKLMETGVEGSFGSEGFTGNAYTFSKGGTFRSDKRRTSAIDPAMQTILNDGYNAVLSHVKNLTFGLVDSLLENVIMDIKLNFKDLTEDQITQKLTEQFLLLGDSMANQLVGLQNYKKDGETSLQTLERLSGSLTSVNSILAMMDQTLLGMTLAGGDAASALLDLFGGMENFTQATGAYYQAFYTEAERNAKTTENLTKSLSGLGFALPDTIENYRKLVEAQDLNTDAGRNAYAALIQLAPAFAQITPAINSASDAANELIKSSADIASERSRLMRELLQEQGDTTTLRNQERNALDESNRALYDQIMALRDQKTAAAEATQSLSERARLQDQIDRLLGNTVALRERERNSISEENRDLFDKIQGLEDQKIAQEKSDRLAEESRRLAEESRRLQQTAAENARRAIEEATRAEQARVDAIRNSTKTLIDEINRLRGVGDTESGQAALQAQFAIVTAQARAGDTEAISKLPTISKALEDATRMTATSARDVAFIRAVLANNLSQTVNTLGGTVPAFANGGMHSGGIRLVGERGPELEATGPARYYSASQTQSMMGGGVVDEIKGLREEVSMLRAEARATAVNTGRTQDIMRRVTRNGEYMIVATDGEALEVTS